MLILAVDTKLKTNGRIVCKVVCFTTQSRLLILTIVKWFLVQFLVLIFFLFGLTRDHVPSVLSPSFGSPISSSSVSVPCTHPPTPIEYCTFNTKSSANWNEQYQHGKRKQNDEFNCHDFCKNIEIVTIDSSIAKGPCDAQSTLSSLILYDSIHSSTKQ
jgi:hypothetical protein